MGRKTATAGSRSTDNMSKHRKIQQARKSFQQSLMNMGTLNESSVLNEFVNKSEVALNKELRKAKVPIKQAKKLVRLISKNRDKMRLAYQE